MDKIVHFEIPADDFERAKKFYSENFGWQLTSVPEMSYTMVVTGPSGEKGPTESGFINGGMFKRNNPDITTPLLVINVENIDESIDKIKSSGGVILKDKMNVGDMGIIAYFKDSEGNVVGLWQALQH